MALIKCKDCGNEVSTLARTCPQCGCPISQTTEPSARVADESPRAETQTQHPPGKRPLILTILCILEFVFTPVGILAALSGMLPAPILILGKSGIRFVAALGMWNMKKWGVYMYGIGIGAVCLIEFMAFQNYANAFAAFLIDLIYPGFVFAVGLYNLSKMK
jgi:hypothetical protein